MLQKISVQNYQSLGSISVDLGNLTVIVGESDSGKSALLRALRSVVVNSTGRSFVRNGENETIVRVQFDDCAIWWQKKESSSYYLKTGSGTKRFDKCGRDVPDIVSAHLRLEPLVLGEDLVFDLHFSDQFDFPFLVAESGARLARVLSEAIEANRILNAAKQGLADSRNEAHQAESSARMIQSLTQQLPKIDIDSLYDSFLGVEEDLIQLVDRTKNFTTLAHFLSQWEYLGTTLSAYPTPTLPDFTAISSLYKEFSRLSTLLSTYLSLPSEIHVPELPVLDESEFIRFGTLLSLWQDYQRMVDELADIDSQTSVAEKYLALSREALTDLEKELKICPLCGKPFHEDTDCR